MPERRDTFSNRLRLARVARGLTQEQVAAEYRISRRAVSQWETGATQPTIDKLKRLSQMYGVSLDWLQNHSAEQPRRRRKFPRITPDMRDALIKQFRDIETPNSSTKRLQAEANARRLGRALAKALTMIHQFAKDHRINFNKKQLREFHELDRILRELAAKKPRDR